MADAKIIDRSKDAVTLFAQAGADWITVMAGAGPTTIHTACTVAHEQGKKIMLDLADASSLGQSALEAKSFGADALVFHKPSIEDQHIASSMSGGIWFKAIQVFLFSSLRTLREKHR